MYDIRSFVKEGFRAEAALQPRGHAVRAQLLRYTYPDAALLRMRMHEAKAQWKI